MPLSSEVTVTRPRLARGPALRAAHSSLGDSVSSRLNIGDASMDGTAGKYAELTRFCRQDYNPARMSPIRVVHGSPDPAHRLDRRSHRAVGRPSVDNVARSGDHATTEITWHGRETMPQQRSHRAV